MLRLFFLVFLLLGMALLTACQSPHKVEYQYILPPTSMDRKCAMQCTKGKKYCQQICRLKHPHCFLELKQKATIQYEKYKQVRLNKGEKIIKTLQDFEHSDFCYSACNCVPSFNTCYTACGGQVITH